MALPIEIVSGIDETNNSTELSTEFEIKLSTAAQNAIATSQASISGISSYDWYVQTPDGNDLEIVDNAGIPNLTTTLSRWGDSLGNYRFYVSMLTGEDESEIADISITGLADEVNENIIETLAPFVCNDPIVFFAIFYYLISL